MLRLSHSKVELYNQCGYKFKLKYIEKFDADKTYTPLLFGSSVDEALNLLLLQMKNKQPIDAQAAKDVFLQKMSAWTGQNELMFFKNEMPANMFIEDDSEGNQQRVFAYLKVIGQKMIDTYVAEILPLFEEVLDVQIKREIENKEGDVFVLVVDFTAKLKDGRVVTFDNKTTSNIKKNYPEHAVLKSQQLSLYTEYETSRLAGYLVLQKALDNDKVVWKMLIDSIPEEMVDTAFEKVDNALRAIKREEFPKNEKSCFAYGKKCEYWDACKRGNYKGLIKR